MTSFTQSSRVEDTQRNCLRPTNFPPIEAIEQTRVKKRILFGNAPFMHFFNRHKSSKLMDRFLSFVSSSFCRCCLLLRTLDLYLACSSHVPSVFFQMLRLLAALRRPLERLCHFFELCYRLEVPLLPFILFHNITLRANRWNGSSRGAWRCK